MAPSIISSGMSSALVTAGMALLPIVVDGVTNLVLNHLPIVNVSPRGRWIFSSIITAGAVYRTLGVPQYNLSNIISGCLYLAYKVYGVISIRSEEALAPHPSIEILRTKYFQLMDRVTIPFDNRSKDVDTFAFEQRETIRKKWQEPEIVRLADELIELAAKEIQTLHQELVIAVHRSGVPQKKILAWMAEKLTDPEGPYSARFCKLFSITLLDIYRAVRGLRFFVIHRDKILSYNVIELEQNDGDSRPFFTPGEDQAKWRDTYNQMVGHLLFGPLMEELKKFSEEQRSKVEWCCDWAVQDLLPQITPRFHEGIFKLFPNGKVSV